MYGRSIIIHQDTTVDYIWRNTSSGSPSLRSINRIEMLCIPLFKSTNCTCSGKKKLNKTKRQNNENKVRMRAVRWRSRMVLIIRERAGSWESEREHSQLYCCLPVSGPSGVSTPSPCEALLRSPCVITLLFLFFTGWWRLRWHSTLQGIWSGPVLDLSSPIVLSRLLAGRSNRSIPQALISAGGQYRASEFSEDSSSVRQEHFSLEPGDMTRNILMWYLGNSCKCNY